MLKKHYGNKGFTLIELMIVICMIGIISAIVVPNFLGRLPNQRLRAAARDIFSAFQRAKLEAVKENENIVILFGPVAYAANGGVGSYQLFSDNGAGGGVAGNWVKDGGEPALLTITMPRGVSLISASFRAGGADPPTQAAGFDGRGLPAGSFIGNVELRTSDRWYRITLSIAGNVTMEKSADGIAWSR